MKYFISCVLVLGFVSCGSQDSHSFLSKSNKPYNSRDVAKPTYSQGDLKPLNENSKFPIRPDFKMTPGTVCERPDEYRYAERIKYCNRGVGKDLKAVIFETYDSEFGFHTQEMDRATFKIDHLIPLCMGGSNESANLWPQHKDVYAYTDPVEPYLCSLMAVGQLKQAEAIQIILEIKQAPMSAVDRVNRL